jgi:MFS family permease
MTPVPAHYRAYLRWPFGLCHQYGHWKCGGAIRGVVPPSKLICRVSWPYHHLHLHSPNNAILSFIVFYSWISSSFPRPPAKRAVALAMINAFSQLGNVAGAYVWGMEANGFRSSYGIVTAMFGVTIIGCWVVRMMLAKLNKQLEKGDITAAWEQHADVAARTAEIEGRSPEEAGVEVKRGFRYLL